MQTAVNPQTGETAVLVGDKWQKAEHVATNPQGQKAYLVGGQWMSEGGPVALPAPKQQPEPSAIERVGRGMLDPFLGAAQLYRRGMAAATTLGGAFPNPVGDYFEREAKDLDRIATRSESDYQAARQQGGLAPTDPGTDWWRVAGNVVSPANVWMAGAIPIKSGMSKLQLAGRGAGLGAAGAAAQPVTSGQDNFWTTKAIQTGVGAAAGAVATPLLSKVTDAVVPRINALVQRFGNASATAGAQASLRTDEIIAQALKETNQSLDDLPATYIRHLRQEVSSALKSGKQLDAASLMRSKDFEALGVAPTRGQITRDATQFATERNLRGTPAGAPLMDRFTEQNQRLAELLNPGRPQEPFQAGDLISSTLKNADEGMRRTVSSMYQTARQETGKDAAVPLQGLAQDAANVLERFRDKVPAGVRARLESYGLFNGTQTRVYSPQEADDLIKLINDHVGSDRATNTALDQLRQAVKRSMMEGEVPDVFKQAREAAAKRFKLQELIPAFDDAAQGRTAPDDFVRKFIVNGKARDVQAMAELLRQTNPEAAEEARKQLAAVLQRAAFGNNAAGDKIFTPERYSTALRNIGTEKLRAFFSPEEIERFSTVGRVGAYINAIPTAAPVSTSNSGVPVVNAMLKTIPRTGMASAVLASVLNPINSARSVNRALSDVAPVLTPNVTPAQAEILARVLAGAGVGAGSLGASPLQK